MGNFLRSSGDIALRALLTEAREAVGLSQEQLARRLNKPQSYVWKLENGERVLAYAEAPAYARALGLKFSEFSLRYAALLRMQTLPMGKRRKPKNNIAKKRVKKNDGFVDGRASTKVPGYPGLSQQNNIKI